MSASFWTWTAVTVSTFIQVTSKQIWPWPWLRVRSALPVPSASVVGLPARAACSGRPPYCFWAATPAAMQALNALRLVLVLRGAGNWARQAATARPWQPICTFKEAGLGNTATTEVVICSADATAVYACLNGGGNHPKAANKATVNGPVSGGGTFPVRNGSTPGSITVGPPGAGSFSCPNGQTLVLASVCYADVTLTGAAGDAATATPNPACRTFFYV